MSINNIMNIGTSGLRTAQTGLRVTSDNISNVNTPGYVRKLVDQRSLSFDGRGQGVEAVKIRLAVDRFLQAAGLNAASDYGRAGAAAELYDRAQTLFGDPSSDSDFFSRMDRMFTAFSATATDPASNPARQAATTAVQSFFDDADRIAAGLQAVRAEADSRIGTAVNRVNDLLQQIEQLNVDISRQTVAGRDSSGAQGVQAQLIDVKLTDRPQGGVNLRTASGMLLAGNGAARLSYAPSSSGGEGGYGEVTITPPGGQPRSLLDHIGSGEIKGLLDLRDTEMGALSRKLVDFVSDTAKALNAAHNASSAVPAPASLNGRNTGLDLPTAIGGLTGRTTVAITDASGVLQRRVDIDFSAGTMSVDGAAASAFTPANFLSSLNTALAPMGGATFTNGALSLTASGGRGVAVADDATTPSANAGKTFSGFFGLNDLVRSDRISDFDTGLRTTDAHGFTAGQTMTFRLAGANGARLKDVVFTVPPGGTMADLVSALNSPSTGLGLYGSFGLDANGRMGFTPSTSPGVTFSVVADTTARGAGGPSVSELFGLGSTVPDRLARDFSVRADIAANPRNLALARLDLSAAAAGKPVLALGDSRGAQALTEAGDFSIGGGMSLSRWASDFSGYIGASAQSAETRREAALALAEETYAQRSSAEGVNMDEELVRLTTYQQAFNASSRLIQAAKEMYDVLLQM